MKCPSCHSVRVFEYMKLNYGGQRQRVYKCKKCGNTFKEKEVNEYELED